MTTRQDRGRWTLEVARERQLDWLLGEALGERVEATPAARPRPWLAAALVMCGFAVVLGVAFLRDEAAAVSVPPQDHESTIHWHECDGTDGLAAVPANVQSLRCFDFDDAACAGLARFGELVHLDLSGTRVDAHGVSRALAITDAGLRTLAKLQRLRWLGLAGCHQVQGYSLGTLRDIPQLEHLDLTYTGVTSTGLELLAELPALRSLSLAHCLDFHGRSLVALTKLPGLRRLELRGCVTLAASDIIPLAQAAPLRHLDLRDCQGRYRGQRAAGFARTGADVFVDADGDGLPERRLAADEPMPAGAVAFVDADGDGLPDMRVDLTSPNEDGIGVTDDVVAALVRL
jgi:hypothetical protein